MLHAHVCAHHCYRGQMYMALAGASHGIGLSNMRHVISIHDVVSDTMHQFAPTYHDYVLYDNSGKKVGQCRRLVCCATAAATPLHT